MALPLIVFAVVLAIVFGAYWLLVLRPEETKSTDLRKRLARPESKVLRRLSVAKEKEPLSNVPALDRLLARRREMTAPLRRLIEQSAVKTTLGVILLSSALLGLVGFVAAQWTARSAWAGLLLGCVLAPIPVLYLVVMRQRRIRRFEELFPEAMDLLARAMRAGHTFPTGLGMVAEEMPQPIAGEFRLLYDRQNFGMPLSDALKEFAARIPLLDARFFVTAVLTQREAGGNLAEVLDNLASVIRRRFKVKREVRSKSAHGRLTGWILVAMPPVMALVFLMLYPVHLRPLVEDPMGIRMLVGAIALQLIGTLLIRKIVRIDY